MVTAEQDPRFFQWAADILKVSYTPGPGCKVLTNLANDGRILGVVVYNRFTPTNCEMSVASDGSGHWVSRKFWGMAFHYPFIQCDLRRVTAVIEEGNEAAIRMDTRLGFRFEGRLRCWFGDKDGIVMGMLRDECRWIR